MTDRILSLHLRKFEGASLANLAEQLRRVAALLDEDTEEGWGVNAYGEYHFEVVDDTPPPPPPEAVRFAAVHEHLTAMHNERWPDAVYLTICPKCNGGDLIVIEANWMHNGQRVPLSIQLQPDQAFYVPGAWDTHDGVTTNEWVRCADCRHTFPLKEITR